MAIEPVMADVIRQLAPTLPNRRVLCLGYPDILTLAEPPKDQERVAICKWHHWPHSVEDAGHFFGKQELVPSYWDIVASRGPEQIIDLNYPLQTVFEPFGAIIDAGTLEHVFNVAQAWQTVISNVAMNGVLVNCNPITMANHAFFSFHPTFYADLLESNGFEIDLLLELSGPLEKRKIRELPKYHRYQPMGEAQILCVSRRKRDGYFVMPTQMKYRRNPALKAAQ